MELNYYFFHLVLAPLKISDFIIERFINLTDKDCFYKY